ncbi:MAG TPA: 2-C-methyl-D-erythritol 4-phosphate cytidylyltransferase [Candidatus Eisenbacteria bacterium]|nr:2-C-methyl-D-erythritol 4-phosphate cytidylyltransferase [Candidatus Eisenbacteria bacterium]
MKIAAIVPAAGRGARLRSRVPKPFVRLLGKPLLVHTLENLSAAFPFAEILVAVDPSKMAAARRLLGGRRLRAPVRVVAGGRTRAESVRNAVSQASAGCDWVLIHDAARPFVSAALVRSVVRAARGSGAALCALPVTSTVKRAGPGLTVRATEDRRTLYLAQTPQVFRKTLLADRFRAAGAAASGATDEAALFDGSKVRVRLVPGESRNIKITTPEDLELFGYYSRKRG